MHAQTPRPEAFADMNPRDRVQLLASYGEQLGAHAGNDDERAQRRADCRSAIAAWLADPTPDNAEAADLASAAIAGPVGYLMPANWATINAAHSIRRSASNRTMTDAADKLIGLAGYDTWLNTTISVLAGGTNVDARVVAELLASGTSVTVAVAAGRLLNH